MNYKKPSILIKLSISTSVGTNRTNSILSELHRSISNYHLYITSIDIQHAIFMPIAFDYNRHNYVTGSTIRQPQYYCRRQLCMEISNLELQRLFIILRRFQIFKNGTVTIKSTFIFFEPLAVHDKSMEIQFYL